MCGDSVDLVDGLPTGCVRASFGYMSTLEDASKLVQFISECFVEGAALSVREHKEPSVCVPLKADVKAEGLGSQYKRAINRGSGPQTFTLSSDAPGTGNSGHGDDFSKRDKVQHACSGVDARSVGTVKEGEVISRGDSEIRPSGQESFVQVGSEVRATSVSGVCVRVRAVAVRPSG